jgi:hypothetical protein
MRLPRAWFLPETHDVLSTLTAQIDVVQTVIGVLRAWCAGAQGPPRTAAHLSNWPRFRVFPSPGMSRDDYSTAESQCGVQWSLLPCSRARQRGLWLRRPGDSRRSAMRWRFH